MSTRLANSTGSLFNALNPQAVDLAEVFYLTKTDLGVWWCYRLEMG